MYHAFWVGPTVKNAGDVKMNENEGITRRDPITYQQVRLPMEQSHLSDKTPTTGVVIPSAI